MTGPLSSIAAVQDGLARQGYVADRRLSTAVFLALAMDKPLFLEGEPGVGKTEIAKALAALLGRPLIRLQCYEGLDVSTAVYEWDYARQMLAIRLAEAMGEADEARAEERIFSRKYLLKRPLLEAVEPSGTEPVVLLIDELDRADEEFEAFLLEFLSEFQISVPEIGTIKAARPPVVIITSNRTREIHDALKRRCYYQWIDYPSFEKECEIVRARIPGAAEALTAEVVRFVQALRAEDVYKRPGVAETLDWMRALQTLDSETLSEDVVDDTLGLLLKYRDDVAQIEGAAVRRLLARRGG
ncbi:MAG: AAA family ATPase [Alphaproteobacteria bacterium]